MQATEEELNIFLITGEIKYTASGHMVNNWWSWVLNPGFPLNPM